MALFFTLLIAVLILHKVPILGEILSVILILLGIWLLVAVGMRYTEIVHEREVQQIERRYK